MTRRYKEPKPPIDWDTYWEVRKENGQVVCLTNKEHEARDYFARCNALGVAVELIPPKKGPTRNG